MSAEVKFLVTANTAQAAAAIEAFVASTDAGLKRIASSSKAANDAAALTAGQVKTTARALSSSLSGLAMTGSLFLGAQAQQMIYPLVFLGKELKSLSGAMKLTGLSLGVVAGGLGFVAAGLGAGYLLWRNYTSGIRETQKAIDDLKAGIATLPAALQTVTTSLRAGLLSPEAAANYRDYLTGKKPLYKSETGEVTTSSSELQLRQEQVFNSTGPGARLVEKMVPLQKASLAEVQKWVQEQVLAGKAVEDVQKALADLRDKEASAAAEAKGESVKQILEIQRKYQAEREEIQKNMDVVRAAGQLSPKKEAAALDALALSRHNELVAVAKVENAQTDAADKKKADALERRKKFAEEQLKIQQELDAQVLKEYEDRKRTLEMERQARVQAVQGDFRLTDKQKYDLLSALGEKNLGPDPASFSQQWTATLVQLQNQWGSWAMQTSQAFASTFNASIDSISNGITGLIMQTQTWGQALYNIGASIAANVVNAIVQMGVRYVGTQIMMAVAGKAILATAIAASAPLAAAQSAIWAVPATLATIASFGGAAAAAPGMIALAEGVTLAQSIAAFEKGGFTGNAGVNDVAGIVHGREYVFSAPAVSRLGVGALDAMHTAAVRGPTSDRGAQSSGGEGKATNIQVHFWDDGSAMKKKIQSDRDVQHVIVDVVRRQSRTITGRS